MSRMRFTLAAATTLVTALVVSSTACAAGSADLDARVLNGHFEALASVRDIPPDVLGLCYGSNTRIAEPGAAFNPTDIADSRPHLRLVWAVTNHLIYIIHMEIGGRSHFYRTIVASVAGPGTSKLLWERAGARLNGFEDFQSTFQRIANDSGKFSR
jgi:hypothetical protein